jgi:2-deoxy-D-gluconate 3-dehydrogenase
MADLFDLTGKRAVVAGGAGGLGSGFVDGLRAAGAEVVVLGRSDSDVTADLGDRGELRRGFDECVARLGGVDILVQSHGVTNAGPALDQPLERWDETLEVNLTSVFELARLAARPMIERGYGKIVNVASMLTFSGGFGAAMYAASKGGVGQLTKALANEWASKGVNVNAIAPGYIKTKLNQHIWRDDPVRTEQITARLSAGRWGEPEDLQGALVFLCSRASDYVHGVILPVDGGYLAR